MKTWFRSRLGVSQVVFRVQVSRQEMNVSLCNVLRSEGNSKYVCVMFCCVFLSVVVCLMFLISYCLIFLSLTLDASRSVKVYVCSCTGDIVRTNRMRTLVESEDILDLTT